METLVLPNYIRCSIVIYCTYLSQLHIPDGVCSLEGLSIYADLLRELYLPRTVIDLGDYSWCNNLSTLYVPDSLKVKLESYDSRGACKTSCKGGAASSLPTIRCRMGNEDVAPTWFCKCLFNRAYSSFV